MKKIFTSLLLLIAIPWIAKAQMAIVDVTPYKIVASSKTLANQIQSLGESLKQTASLASIVNTAVSTEKIVNNTLTLATQVQNDLKAVTSITRMKWSNLNTMILNLSTISTDYTNLVPNPNQGMAGQIFEPGAGQGNGAKSIFMAANNRGQSVLNEPDAITNQQQTMSTRLQLDDAAAIRKIQTADFFDQTANDLAQKAVELQSAVNIANMFTMSHAERLSTLKMCAESMIEAAQLHMMADKLRQESLLQTPAQSEKTRQAKQNLLIAEHSSMLNALN